jgi:hypothetical protein
MQFSEAFCNFNSLGIKYSSQRPILKHCQVSALLLVWKMKFLLIQNNRQNYSFVHLYFNLYFLRSKREDKKCELSGRKLSPNLISS